MVTRGYYYHFIIMIYHLPRQPGLMISWPSSQKVDLIPISTSASLFSTFWRSPKVGSHLDVFGATCLSTLFILSFRFMCYWIPIFYFFYFRYILFPNISCAWPYLGSGRHPFYFLLIELDIPNTAPTTPFHVIAECSYFLRSTPRAASTYGLIAHSQRDAGMRRNLLHTH